MDVMRELNGRAFATAVDRAEDGRHVISVHGDLDIATTPELIETLWPLLRPYQDVIIDLTETAFVDSAGLRCLVQAATEMRVNSGEMLVVSPLSSQLRRLLEITDLAHELEIVGSLADA